MPTDRYGNTYVDLVSPPGPAYPVDLNRPIDIPGTVNALVAAGPEAGRRFLQQAKQRMDPDQYNRAITALYKAGRAQRTGPAGTPWPNSPTRGYPRPAAPTDPAYLSVLRQSGAAHRYGRHPHDPRR